MQKSLHYKKREVNMRRRVNVIPAGRTFGEWTVVRKGLKPDYLECVCSCDTLREVHVYSLTSGKSVSCGCLRRKKNGT